MRAVELAGGDVVVSADAAVIARAGRLVLPGVGAFGDCRRWLDGVVDALREAVIERGVPVLGICVGMQLLADCGLEGGVTAGLGWIPGRVVPLGAGLSVPHMGWNELRVVGGEAGHPVLRGVGGQHAYFVHGYHFVCAPAEHRLAVVDYGGPVVAAVGRDNIVGVQFHPEKSQGVGVHLLGNFLVWWP